MMSRRPLRFYCFSPPVMLATFIIEICLTVYTLVRYRLNKFGRITAGMLFFLALFQLAEYNVCGGFGASAQVWARVGFASITILPALGIHLLEVITGRGWRAVKWLAYVNALAWIVTFAFSQHAFGPHVCAGNYIIFRLNPSIDRYYYFYYYGWLIITMGTALYFAAITKKAIREACLLLLIGYAIFLLPTTVVNTLNPASTDGIPSIMCGFAVIFAFILTFGILPLKAKAKTQPPKNTK